MTTKELRQYCIIIRLLKTDSEVEDLPEGQFLQETYRSQRASEVEELPEGDILQETFPSRRWCVISIFGLWSAVFLYTCPPLFNVGVRYGLEPLGISCTIDYWHPDMNSGFALYIGILIIFAYSIPIAIMIACMLKTSKVLSKCHLVKG